MVHCAINSYLKKFFKLPDDVSGLALLLASPHLRRRTDDIAELEGQFVLLAPSAPINDDARTNTWWRNRQDCEYHPFWPRVFLRESKQIEIRVGYLFEDRVYVGRTE